MAGDLELDWAVAGAVHGGEDLMGACDLSGVTVPATIDVVTLQDFYDGAGIKDKCSRGAIYDQVEADLAKIVDKRANSNKTDALRQARIDEISSLVDAAVAALEESAVEGAESQLNSAELRIWILMYKLSADLRSLGPFSRPPDDNVTGVQPASYDAGSLFGGSRSLKALCERTDQGWGKGRARVWALGD